MASVIFKYPLTLGSIGANEGNQHIITFVALKYNENSGKTTNHSEVNLYITGDALKTAYGQVYADTAMGASAGFLMQNQNAAASAYGALESAVGGAAGFVTGGAGVNISDIIKNIGGPGQRGAGGAAASTLKTALEKGQLQQTREALGKMGPGIMAAIDASRGSILNPHKALVYQGPGGFRQFTFSYKFSPASLEEAKAVANIVYFFKYHMHPSLEGTASNTAGAPIPSGKKSTAIFKSIDLKYPDEFLLEIKPRQGKLRDKLGEPKTGKANPLFKIDRCFLETCNVDYSTDGVPAFFQKETGDGDQAYPVTTSLSLAFKETKVLTREDIAEGY